MGDERTGTVVLRIGDAGSGSVHRPRHPRRPVPDPPEGGLRGDGGGLQSAPAVHEPDGRDQDPPPEAREPQRPRLALPARSARDEPSHAPEHREGVSLRGARRRVALHHHGVPRGEEPEPDGARGGGLPVPARAAGADPGVRCARRSAQDGDHPPRPEAGERLSLPAGGDEGLREGARLRPRQSDRARDAAGEHHPHAGGDGLRDAGVHEPRASAGESPHAGERHLFARGHPLRGADDEAPVRGEDGDGLHPGARDGEADPDRGAGPREGIPTAPLAGHRARAGEGAGGPLRERRRFRDGDAGGARGSHGAPGVADSGGPPRAGAAAAYRAASRAVVEEATGVSCTRTDVDQTGGGAGEARGAREGEGEGCRDADRAARRCRRGLPRARGAHYGRGDEGVCARRTPPPWPPAPPGRAGGERERVGCYFGGRIGRGPTEFELLLQHPSSP